MTEWKPGLSEGGLGHSTTPAEVGKQPCIGGKGCKVGKKKRVRVERIDGKRICMTCGGKVK